MKRKTSILVIDDDPGMTETLADILNDLDYDVDVAANGIEAIEMVKKKKYNITLIDIRMPGINGVETLSEIKRIRPSVGAIMMTAYSLDSTMKEAIGNGALDILHKPFDIGRLIDLIEQAQDYRLHLRVERSG